MSGEREQHLNKQTHESLWLLSKTIIKKCEALSEIVVNATKAHTSACSPHTACPVSLCSLATPLTMLYPHVVQLAELGLEVATSTSEPGHVGKRV